MVVKAGDADRQSPCRRQGCAVNHSDFRQIEVQARIRHCRARLAASAGDEAKRFLRSLLDEAESEMRTIELAKKKDS